MLVDVFLQSEDGQTRQERVEGGAQITVGRHTQCTIVLESDLVSRHHATMMFGLEAFRVEDTSSNGTVVGDVVLRHEALDVPYGTLLVIGNYTMQIFPALAGISVEAAAVRPGSQSPPSGRPDMRSSRPAAAPTAMAAPVPTPAPPRPTRAPPGAPAPTTGDTNVSATRGGVSTPTATAGSRALAPPRLPRALARDTMEDGALGVEAAPTARGHKDETELRQEVLRRLRESPDFTQVDVRGAVDDPTVRARVHGIVRRTLRTLEHRLPVGMDPEHLALELTRESVGLGCLEELLGDASVRGIVVQDAVDVFVERESGVVQLTALRFTDDERARICLERLVGPQTGASFAAAALTRGPLLDARLADGSRVSALFAPVARRGVCFSIRKATARATTLEALTERGVLPTSAARFLARCVLVRKNVLVTGPATSGKSMLVAALASACPVDERVVVFEGDEPIVLPQRHVVPLEASPLGFVSGPSPSGRAVLASALRLRPHRVVAAALPAGAALDVLAALGADRGAWILEAAGRTPEDAVTVLESQAASLAGDAPSRPLRELLAAGLHVLVHMGRGAKGAPVVVGIHEVTAGADGVPLALTPVFEAHAPGAELRVTGHVPGFVDEFVARGLVHRGEAPI